MTELVNRRFKVAGLQLPRLRISGDVVWIVAPPVITLLIWEALVRVDVLEAIFFPPPTKILQTLVELTRSGDLVTHVSITVERVLLGFVLGAIPGVILGLTMGMSKKLRAVFDPFIAATYPMPKIAMLPLIMLIFGVGELSKVVTIAMGVFYLVVINAMVGVGSIDPIYFEIARNYGADRFKIFVRVVFPGSLPEIFAGIRLGMGVAVLIAIAVELLSAQRGLGAMIWLAWQTLRTEVLYVGIMIAGVLGLVATAVVELAKNWLIPWQEEAT